MRLLGLLVLVGIVGLSPAITIRRRKESRRSVASSDDEDFNQMSQAELAKRALDNAEAKRVFDERFGAQEGVAKASTIGHFHSGSPKKSWHSGAQGALVQKNMRIRANADVIRQAVEETFGRKAVCGYLCNGKRGDDEENCLKGCAARKGRPAPVAKIFADENVVANKAKKKALSKALASCAGDNKKYDQASRTCVDDDSAAITRRPSAEDKSEESGYCWRFGGAQILGAPMFVLDDMVQRVVDQAKAAEPEWTDLGWTLTQMHSHKLGETWETGGKGFDIANDLWDLLEKHPDVKLFEDPARDAWMKKTIKSLDISPQSEYSAGGFNEETYADIEKEYGPYLDESPETRRVIVQLWWKPSGSHIAVLLKEKKGGDLLFADANLSEVDGAVMKYSDEETKEYFDPEKTSRCALTKTDRKEPA